MIFVGFLSVISTFLTDIWPRQHMVQNKVYLHLFEPALIQFYKLGFFLHFLPK